MPACPPRLVLEFRNFEFVVSAALIDMSKVHEEILRNNNNNHVQNQSGIGMKYFGVSPYEYPGALYGVLLLRIRI